MSLVDDIVKFCKDLMIKGEPGTRQLKVGETFPGPKFTDWGKVIRYRPVPAAGQGQPGWRKRGC